MSRTIAVISGKGGVGKTTTALNLGAVLSNKFDKNVTIVDCNVTASHLGLHLGMYYHPTNINHVLKEESHIHDATHDHHDSKLKIVPASLSLDDLHGVDMSLLRDSIQHLGTHSDIVLLDGAPGLGREAMATIKAADEVLYVTTPYVPAVMDVVRTKDIVNELGKEELGIVVNMRENDRHEMNKEEIEQLTRLPVIGTVPHDKNVKRSLHKKMPVVLHKPRSKSSKAYHKLATTLTGESYETPGLMGEWFTKVKKKIRRQ